LACSGCVTSSEAVLISQHSSDELIKVIESNKKLLIDNPECDQVKLICVSLSPQSRASLAVKYNMTIDECTRKLCGFFEQHLGAKYIFDTTFSREFSLLESRNEFIRRFHQNRVPILTSVCPGWICYAEKTHGSFILPYISNVKSPQQVMGSLVKDYLSKKLKMNPNQIYHVSIMPCFDKKLESTRNDFFNETYQSKDVDCVLSTNEIEQLLEKEDIDLFTMPDAFIHLPFFNETSQITELKSLYYHPGGGSGGYAVNVLIHAAKHLFNYDLKSEDIVYKQLRNIDFKELNLEINGEIKLKFAIAYGFRNIQNIVQKIKKQNCPYQYVEIMACPSGCLNGGGQIRDPQTNTLTKELFSKVEQAYHTAVPLATYEAGLAVDQLYKKEWLNEDSNKIDQFLHTKYHEVEKFNNALNIKW